MSSPDKSHKHGLWLEMFLPANCAPHGDAVDKNMLNQPDEMSIKEINKMRNFMNANEQEGPMWTLTLILTGSFFKIDWGLWLPTPEMDPGIRTRWRVRLFRFC
jgi:hypothetical protein